MAIGRKSKVVELSIHNYKVKVQANKNYGIYDIILCEKTTKEVSIEITEPNGKKRTVKKMKTFYKPIRRITEVLSEFQGRQYNDSDTMLHLSNVLTEIL